jgi:hypothetical protein
MSVSYVAYIDESGDPGLRSVKPINPKGASEWLVLSCFLVREENDRKMVGWIKEIQSQFYNVQNPYLHYSTLSDDQKAIACKVLAQKPCRLFVVMSNKKNIETYRNRNIKDGNKNWLYWWIMRILLERVTDFCEQRTPPEMRGKNKLRIVFSRRGGMQYQDFKNYLDKIARQSRAGRLVVDEGDLRWSMIDTEEIFAYDHKARAGLQLADIGAGAFFQAVENNRPANCDPKYAQLLMPRMAKNTGAENVLGYGIKTMPCLHKMQLAGSQKEIFEMYGYNKEGW